MDELRSALLCHATRYPLMQPTDAVKLIYQNEYGGGHLIRDEQQCLQYLLQEYRRTPQLSAVPLAESIGNGIFRVHLNALDAHGYCADALGKDFIRSSSIQKGSSESFLRKLELLQQMTREGLLPFSSESLEPYLKSYAEAGYPVVSHSEIYRAAYAPAYRIIREEFLPKLHF